MMRNSAQLFLGFPAGAMALAVLVYGCSLVVSYPDIETGTGAGAGTNTGGTHSGGGGTGGTGAGGNSGGGPIGGGGASATPFVCNWTLADHHYEVDFIENFGNQNEWSSRILGNAWDDDGHLLTVMELSGTAQCYDTCAEVRNINGNNNPSQDMARFDISKLYDMELLDDDRALILYGYNQMGDNRLYVKLVHAGNLQTGAVHDVSGMLPGDWNIDRAALTIVDASANPPAFDYVALVNIGANDPVEYFGRFDDGTASLPTRITQANVTLGDQDDHIQDIVHHAGVTYVFMGDATAELGSRLYTITTDPPGELQARQIGPTGTFPGAMQIVSDHLNIAGAILPDPITDPFQFLAGSVPMADIGTFELGDLPVASLLADINNFPAGEGALMRWFGDAALLFGGTYSDSTQLAYGIYDSLGNERSDFDNPQLEFRGVLPNGMIRDGVEDTIGGARETQLFVSAGGDAPVAWMETQHDGTIARQVIYFDILRCLRE